MNGFLRSVPTWLFAPICAIGGLLLGWNLSQARHGEPIDWVELAIAAPCAILGLWKAWVDSEAVD